MITITVRLTRLMVNGSGRDGNQLTRGTNSKQSNPGHNYPTQH